MATLSEVAAWVAGIYQIEQTDPVLGGAPNETTGAGLTNIPAQQLAKRTRWLREYIEGAGLGMSSVDPVDDLDALSGGGFYTANASAVGSPDGTAAVAVLHIPATASTGGFQVAFRQGSTTRLWVRRKTAGAWAGWLELLHSGNMGTAAQATLQTSPTDGNAGRVLLVGGFGLGGDAPRCTNLNSVTDTGFYEILAADTGAPPQSPSTWANGALIHITGAAGQKTQIVSLNGDGSQGFLQMRIDDGTGAGYSDWRVFFNSGSTIPVANGGTGATTASAARAALGAVADTRTITAGLGLAGGGDLSANRTLDLALGELDPVDAGAFAQPRFPVIDGVNSATQGRSTSTQMRNALAVYSKAETDALVTASAIRTLISQTPLGAVGSYAFLRRNSANQPIAKGDSYAGSALRYAGVIDSDGDYKAQLELADNSAPSGTWMAMGSVGNLSTQYSATLFLRIA